MKHDNFHDEPRGYLSLMWEQRWIVWLCLAIGLGLITYLIGLILIHVHVMPLEVVAEASRQVGRNPGGPGLWQYHVSFVVYLSMLLASVWGLGKSKPW